MSTDKNKNKCVECGNYPFRHRIFCTKEDQEDFADFLEMELRTSLQKQWDSERDFADITKQFLNAEEMQRYSVTERKVRAGQSAERKLAAMNCEYFMKRATMFATALSALNSRK